MKPILNKILNQGWFLACLLVLVFQVTGFSQEDMQEESQKTPRKYVKDAFESVWLIDNQTTLVPVKGTFEFDIQHRFGRVNSEGEFDLFGLFAPSNIRMGLSYVPVKNLMLGVGLTKDRTILDGTIKYALLRQTAGSWTFPVSITYYGNMGIDLKEDPEGAIYKYRTNRYRYFHQLLISSKLTNWLTVQVAPSLSYQNSVDGYYYNEEVKPDSFVRRIGNAMEHAHFALATSARIKITPSIAFMINYDQPITKHVSSNPNPNISFGFEFGTSGHSFQIFAGNYRFLNPQRNNLFNNYSPLAYTNSAGEKIEGGNFVIGFNITRLWNF